MKRLILATLSVLALSTAATPALALSDRFDTAPPANDEQAERSVRQILPRQPEFLKRSVPEGTPGNLECAESSLQRSPSGKPQFPQSSV